MGESRYLELGWTFEVQLNALLSIEHERDVLAGIAYIFGRVEDDGQVGRAGRKDRLCLEFPWLPGIRWLYGVLRRKVCHQRQVLEHSPHLRLAFPQSG